MPENEPKDEMDRELLLADEVYEGLMTVVTTRQLPAEMRQRLEPYQFTPVAFAEGGDNVFAVMYVVRGDRETGCQVEVFYRNDHEGTWQPSGGGGTGWPSSELRPFWSSELGTRRRGLGHLLRRTRRGKRRIHIRPLRRTRQTQSVYASSTADCASFQPMRFGAWLANTRSVDLDYHPEPLN